MCSILGSLFEYGTYYLGYPKRDPNFDSHPCVYGVLFGAFGLETLWVWDPKQPSSRDLGRLEDNIGA